MQFRTLFTFEWVAIPLPIYTTADGYTLYMEVPFRVYYFREDESEGLAVRDSCGVMKC